MEKMCYYLDYTKDVSVEIYGEKGQYYINVYNDKTNKSVALNLSASQLLGLADSINKYVGSNQ